LLEMSNQATVEVTKTPSVIENKAIPVKNSRKLLESL
jgi:hypothetical protein